VVDITGEERKEDMKKVNIEAAPCSECGGRIERKYISQEFEREGLTVKLSGIAALVCAKCGEIYLQPGGADKVADAANSLFRLAQAEKQHKHGLTAQICRA